MNDTYPQTTRTIATRERHRMSYDRAAVHGVLDEAFHSHLSFVVDGEPRVLPTLHVRVGEKLFLHGSTGSRPLLVGRGRGGGGPPERTEAVRACRSAAPSGHRQ